MAIHIHDLPNEVLHLIALSLPGPNDTLSQVSKRVSPIAREMLLTRPVLDIDHMHGYLLQIHSFPHLLPQIHTLEISNKQVKSASKNSPSIANHLWSPCFNTGSARHCRQVPAPSILANNQSFDNDCRRMNDSVSNSPRMEARWIAAAANDCLPALLGILISILPNLKELRCESG